MNSPKLTFKKHTALPVVEKIEIVERDTRRNFLGKSLTLGAAITIAPGIMLHTLSGTAHARDTNIPASWQNRWGLLIDTNKCTPDCTACVQACNKEHGLESTGRASTDAQWIRKVELSNPQTGVQKSLPVMCQHCEEPPCVDVCPTGASFKRADGIVLVDKHDCIGCRYCMMACPYSARSFIHEELSNQKPYSPRGKGTVESCNLCVHKIDGDGEPACVTSCHIDGKGAMTFGDLNDPTSDISKKLVTVGGIQIRADLGLNPGVHYQGL
jgi:molybdopterin-containing oxidoreductase family iron-sulfur binding subunit